MTSSNPAIDAAHTAALARWNQPFPGYASGMDPRTSDQALLTLFYGGLEHAARYEWLNAGRRLIDRTYIDILWRVQALSNMRTSRPEQIAASLDRFIIDTVRPLWDSLPTLTYAEKLETATAWVEQMARDCFGSVHSELAASRLMYFLLPTLPVFNLSRGHWLALDRIGHRPLNESYRAFVQAILPAYREHLPELTDLASPTVSLSDPWQSALIERLLAQTDWWTRSVFDAYLRGSVPRDTAGTEDLFGCNDAGGFTEGIA